MKRRGGRNTAESVLEPSPTSSQTSETSYPREIYYTLPLSTFILLHSLRTKIHSFQIDIHIHTRFLLRDNLHWFPCNILWRSTSSCAGRIQRACISITVILSAEDKWFRGRGRDSSWQPTDLTYLCGINRTPFCLHSEYFNSVISIFI